MASQHVAIFWDYENCCPPSNMSGYLLVENIRRVAQPFGRISQFKAYLEITPESAAQRPSAFHSELQSSGVSLTHCPHNGKKDVADKMMLVDMLAFAIDQPAPATVILISGDRDFSYGVSILKLRGYAVVIIAPLVSAHPSLKAQATELLSWQDDVLKAAAPPRSRRRSDSPATVPLPAAALHATFAAPFTPTPSRRQPRTNTISSDNSDTKSTFSAWRRPQMHTHSSLEDAETMSAAWDEPRVRAFSFSNVPETNNASKLLTPPSVEEIAAGYLAAGHGGSEIKLSRLPAEAEWAADKSADNLAFSSRSIQTELMPNDVKSGGSSVIDNSDPKDIHSSPSSAANASILLPVTTGFVLPSNESKERALGRFSYGDSLDETVDDLATTFSATSEVVNGYEAGSADEEEQADPFTAILLRAMTVPLPTSSIASPLLTSGSAASVPRFGTLVELETQSVDLLCRGGLAFGGETSELVEASGRATAAPQICNGAFDILVQVLYKLRSAGHTRPGWSQVGEEVMKRDALAYEHAGANRLKKYMQLAEGAGLVVLGGFEMPGREWIELRVPTGAPEAAGLSAGSQQEVGPGFGRVVTLLKMLRAEGVRRPLWSRVGELLPKRYPRVYSEAGVSGLKQYLALAEEAGVVALGTGKAGKEWVGLRDECN